MSKINISSIIRNFFATYDFDKLTNSQIADYIQGVNNLNTPRKTLVTSIGMIRKKLNSEIKASQLNFNFNNDSNFEKKKIEDFKYSENDTKASIKTPYKVTDGDYIFFPKKGEFSISVETIDRMFYEYSEHGLDLQSTELIRIHQLEVWQWHAIKNALRLYKKSHIFSPHTVDSTEPDKLQEMVDKKMTRLTKDLGHVVVKSYNKAIFKGYKDAIKKLSTKDLELETILTDLIDYLPTCEVKPEIHIKNEVVDGNLNIFLADIHFGLNNKGKEPSYSPEIVLSQLLEIANVINKYQYNSINIFGVGDIVESVSGLNHLNTWKSLKEGYYGSFVIIELYKILVQFLSSINNLSSFNLIPGNHDRSSASNKEDTEGFIARIIFELVKNSFKDSSIEFNYDDIIISKKIGNINYLVTHGHLGISQMSAAELILEYGDPTCFNLCLQGHFHERRVKKDTKNFRDLVIPSIMPGNTYSIRSGYSTCPGFLIVKENENRKPIILDYSI